MISLLSEFLKLDWRKRITAVDALKHPYFTSPPLPARPGDLPQFEDSHELDRRQYRQKPKPPAPPNGAAGESDWSTGPGARAAAGQSSRVPAGAQRGGPAPRGDFRRAPDVRSPFYPSLFGLNKKKLIYNRTASHQNHLQSHNQDGPIAKTTAVPLTAATAAVAMEDDLIHTSLDTMDTTTITTIAITETAIITSTMALVRVMACRRIAGTVTEAIIPIPAMPDDEAKVRR